MSAYSVCQIRCTNTARLPGCPGHCRHNIFFPLGGPQLPDPGTELPSETKAVFVFLAQQKCPRTDPKTCRLYVVGHHGASVYAEMVQEGLGEAGVPEADRHLQSIVRNPSMPAHIAVKEGMERIGDTLSLSRLAEHCLALGRSEEVYVLN